jgi:tetratricopeptide (TPR) repeat protein/transcriptional regulator with XRE-family HTH domain
MVRANRLRLALTQEQLAHETGLSVRGIRRIEGGGTAPRVGTVRLLADAFRLTGADRERFCRSGAGQEVHQEAHPDAEQTRECTAPAQLPPDVWAFTGRASQLARLDALLDGAGTQPAAVLVSALSGPAGVGKTALAVHWAHRVRDRFPDGQLYLNLRGYDPDRPVTATDALGRSLAALGLAGPDIPEALEDRAARYRSELDGRRMLVVLDNAATTEQVRPLLPGSGSCVVVITSRDRLPGLVAVNGAHRIDLDPLPPAEAVALLGRLIGPRVDAEPEAAAALAVQCARLPLALRVAAELAVSRPVAALAGLVAELADRERRLDLLDAGGDPHAAVRAVFSWSIHHLPPVAARAFRLLGLHPGPDLDPYAAAALAGTGLEEARHALLALARANLVHATGAGRYAMHDLLRAYANRLCVTEEAAEHRVAAEDRMFAYYSAAAAAAMDSRYPAEAHRRPRIPRPGTPMPDLADPDVARAWLDAERPCLVAVAAVTPTPARSLHAIRLSNTLYRYLQGGHYLEAMAIHRDAHRVAVWRDDPAEQANALRYLGATHVQTGRYGPAVDCHRQALALFRRVGDEIGEALAVGSLGVVEQRLGHYALAASHHRRARALFRRIGDLTGEALSVTSLGIIEDCLGHYASAAGHHRQALALFEKLSDPYGTAHALNALGWVEAHLGEYSSAADHHRQALDLFRCLGNAEGEAYSLHSLGVVHIGLGQAALATERFEHALGLFRTMGDQDGEAWALNGLGEAANLAGDPTTAVSLHGEALARAVHVGVPTQQARAHTGLGRAHHALGQFMRAHAHYQHALSLYTDLDTPAVDQVRASLAALA